MSSSPECTVTMLSIVLFLIQLSRSAAQAFRHYILDTKEIRSPIKYIGDAQFFHVRLDNLYLVAIAHQNVNAAMIFEVCFALLCVV